MSQFIDIDDYDATLHREILDALVRDDKQVIEVCEDRAIAEMRSYAAQGAERNQLVLMFALDIAVYHIFCIHNPHNMSQIRIDRYERAVEWLKGIQKGMIRVDGLPEMTPEQGREKLTPLLVSSDRKHRNYM